MRRDVAVWKSTLLPYSETFVLTQGESLVSYRARYVGLVDVGELALPADRAFVLGRTSPGAVRVFKATGRSPALVRALDGVSLVHAHFGFEAWRALQLARRAGVPVVVTFHGADATTSDDALRRTSASARQYVRHRQRIFRDVARCIAVSSYIADRLIDAGCPPEKVVVHQIGVDSTRFRPPAALRRTKELLFVGRLVEKKGVSGLLSALALLETGVRPGLVVVGDGPLRAELERQAQQEGVAVDFVGRQRHDQVRTWMHRAGALVVPSRDAGNGEAEGLPTVIREAQASGLPVIVSDVAGSTEAVDDGATGLVVGAGDPRSLATAIARLAGDSTLQERLRTGGLAAARTKDVVHQARSLEAIYDEVLGT